MWEISKCYFAVLYAAQSQIYIPDFLAFYTEVSHAIWKEEREKQTPCIHFELYVTLNHFLKKQAGENLHDLFNIDVDYISEQVCEQKYLGRNLNLQEFWMLVTKLVILVYITICTIFYMSFTKKDCVFTEKNEYLPTSGRNCSQNENVIKNVQDSLKK